VNGNGQEPEPIEAVRALRDRGIDNAEELLAYGTPAEILAACRRWDGRQGVGPGLLARWIRDGRFDDEPAAAQSKAEMLRARFDEYARQYPVGSTAEPHATLQARCNHDEDPCPGSLRVVAISYPHLTLECDACDYSAALTPRSLRALPLAPTQPELEPDEHGQPF
jgi:hypothetical protein